MSRAAILRRDSAVPTGARGIDFDPARAAPRQAPATGHANGGPHRGDRGRAPQGPALAMSASRRLSDPSGGRQDCHLLLILTVTGFR